MKVETFFYLLALSVSSCVVPCAHAGKIAWITTRPILDIQTNEIPATVLIPQVAPPSKGFPALLVFGGFENAGEVLELIKTDEPVVLASFDYPYHGPRKYNFSDALDQAPAIRQATLDTIAGILALNKYLSNAPQINAQNIGVVGASFGSPFALISASQDPTIKNLVLIHGFADLTGTIAARLEAAWKKKLGFWTNFVSWITSKLIVLYIQPPPLEGMAEDLKSHQRVLVINATEDGFIPRRSTEILAASLLRSKAKVEIIQTPGGHLMPGSDHLIADIIEKVRIWLKAQI